MEQQCLAKIYSWQQIISWLPVVGLLMVLSALPFGWSDYQRIGLYVLGIGYVTDYIVNRRWQQFAWDRGKWIYAVMLLLVALFFFREWLDPTPLTAYAQSQFHIHEWFLYIGIAGMLGFSDKLQLRHVAYVMLATSVVMLGTCCFLYFCTDELANVTPFMRFNLLRRLYINSHMVMNLYINTAMILGFAVLKDEPSRWRKVLLFVAIMLSWLLILISDGRIGLATSLLVIVVCGMAAIPRKHLYVSLIVGVVLAIGAGLFVAQNPRVSFKKIANDPRTAIYDFSWRMIQKEPVAGYGLSTLSVEYVEQAYQDSVMYYGYIVPCVQTIPDFAQLGKTMKTHHAHNAFLHYWLIFGIAGPLILLALLVTATLLPIDKRYRIYLWLFLLAVLIQCMTEPIGQHIKPQFITLMLLIWQCAAVPFSNPQKDALCES